MAVANSVYDDEEEKKSLGSREDSSDESNGAYTDSEQGSTDDLSSAEEMASQPNGGTNLSSTEPSTQDSSEESPFSYRNVGGKKRHKLSKKNKMLVVGAGGSLFFIIVIIAGILSFFSTQKILQLSEHITVYNMARSARTFRLASSEIIEENIATETMSESTLARLKSAYGETRVAKAIESINKLRPEKVFKNLNTKFEPVYATEGKGKVLKGFNYLSEDGTTAFVEKANQKFFRPFSNSAERVRFAAETTAVLEKDLQGTNTIVRSRVISKLLKERGIRLKWWDKLGKNYDGLTQEASARLAASEALDELHDPPESSCKVQTLCTISKETDDAVKSATDDVLENKAGGAKTFAQAGDDALAKTLDSSAKNFTNGLGGVIEKASLFYAIAVPLCLIYDGSIENAQGTIDANQKALQKTFFAVRSAADQQKAGDTTATAVGGLNDKIGDISNSIPERRTSGVTADTTSQANGLELPQTSSTGTYTLINVAFKDTAAAEVINLILKEGCSFMTRIDVGIGAAFLEWGAALFSGGSSGAVEGAAKASVDVFIENLTKRLLFTETRKLIQEVGIREVVGNVASKFLIRTGLMVGGTVGLTELAKLAVLKHMSAANNGLAMDEAFANQADMGGNLYAQDTNRTLLYGKPMTTPEVAESKMDDLAYINELNSRKSVYERYFALSDPSSVVSKLGFSSYLFMTKKESIANKLTRLMGNTITSPARIFSTAFLGKNKYVHAATVEGAGDYNIVQWGWSSEELAIIDNNPDKYSPMENELFLEQSGREPDIEKKYGRCFTDSVGSLLSSRKPAILRDEEGKVIPDDGLCSPNELGINNKEFGDLVFRWRLKNRNAAILDHLLGIQDPTVENAASQSSSSTNSTSTPTSSPNACATGTTYAQGPNSDGTFDGYVDGTKKPIILCSVDDLPVQAIDGDGSESTPGTKYYIASSNGKALIEASKSSDLAKMVTQAKNDGTPLVAISSFRTNEHQTAACGNVVNGKCTNSGYSVPGFSKHQSGQAIDFLDSNRNSTKNCKQNMVGGKCVGTDAIWKWLNANANTYGFYQNPTESWHWSSNGK